MWKVKVKKMRLKVSRMISDLMDYSEIGEHDFDISVTYNGNTVVAVESDDTLFYLENHYNEWKMLTKGETIAEQYNYLKLCFTEYLTELQNSMNRIYAALMSDYDPTSDYIRHEQQSYKNTHSNIYSKAAMNSTIDLESKTEYNSTVADDIKTYDSVNVSDARATNKTGDDTTTMNGKQSTTSSGTDLTTDTRLKNDNQRDVTGNNAAPQDMIEKEIALRMRNDFSDIVINGFADKYLFLTVEG